MTAGARDLTVHITRVLAAPRANVFRAHTEREQLAQWFGPEGFTARLVELDVRRDGRYRIVMQPPAGERFSIEGEFREVEPSSRLVYTFRYDAPDPDDRETIVTFSLDDDGASTLVTVDQQGFATEARRALHEQGWSDSLDRLQRLITGEDLTSGA